MRRKEIHVCVKVMLSFNNGLADMSGLNVLFNHIAPVVSVNMSMLTLTGWDRTMFLGSECGSIRCGCRAKEEQTRHLTLEHLVSSSEAALAPAAASLLDDVPL